MDRPAERRFQAAERRRMPAAAAKRHAASGRRGSDAVADLGAPKQIQEAFIGFQKFLYMFAS
jgi:hypothetical protein